MRLVGPAVRFLLQQYGLNSTKIPTGSGRNGILLKGDILKFVEQNKLQAVVGKAEAVKVPILTTGSGKIGTSAPIKPAPKKGAKREPYIDIEVTSMRKTIAKRLLQSKTTIPHAYATVSCELENVLALRKRVQAVGLAVSVNDFIIKCSSNALARCPQVNIVWEGQQLKMKSQIDISVAVATKAGLLTPIVPNVNEKNIAQIGDMVKALAAKAKDGKLQPNEFMGGTFTISNLGMFGISHFTAIINPPQCAILAVGGGHVQCGKSGKLTTTLKLSLSYDGRAIMEDTALEFLALLKNEIETVNEVGIGLYSLDDEATLYRYSSVTPAAPEPAPRKK